MTENDTQGDGVPAVDGGETYTCEACGMEFDSEEDLERHVHEVGIVD